MKRSAMKMLTPVATVKMTEAMALKPLSLTDLIDITGLGKPTVTRFIKSLTEAKMAHVGGWARDPRGYPTIRQYAMGNKPDVACPRTDRTAADRMRLLRADRKVGLK